MGICHSAFVFEGILKGISVGVCLACRIAVGQSEGICWVCRRVISNKLYCDI